MDVEIKMGDWIQKSGIKSNNLVATPIDLTFRDLGYTVGKGKKSKTILNQVSGVFKSGQLSAILGPSGAGKTSLMNILAGLKGNKEVDGHVEVNGTKRDKRTFRKQSAYIMQKDYLLSNLTVYEYMLVSAHLKLGNHVSNHDKISTIEVVLMTLGLTTSSKTRISSLSGGECKRLSIGLEMIDNPAVLFLDEPTSGLDSSSSLQCVALLQNIARSGRTVITTIHQPSSRLLDHFDHLYIVASGSCIYQGSVASLVPYFQSMNLDCPSYHNPADFAMDVACGEYGNVLAGLVAGIENGRIIYEECSPTPSATSSLNQDVREYEEDHKLLDDSVEKKKTKTPNRLVYAAPFRTQFAILLEQSWRTIWRGKVLTAMRGFIHIAVGILLGILYWQTGDQAAIVFSNAGFLYFTQFFILFTSMMPTVLTFPLEKDVLIREHLNHWYSLKAYYLAKTLADFPFQIIFPTIFLVFAYVMSNQPMDLERFGMLLSITICTALIGQGIGMLFGAAFGIQIAIFLSPTTAIPFVLLSGFCLKMSSIPPYFNWITYTSFMRFGFDGAMMSVYGYDREPLSCSLPYCHFRYPQKFLEIFDLKDGSYYWSIFSLLVIVLVLRILGYFVLRFKLRNLR